MLVRGGAGSSIAQSVAPIASITATKLPSRAEPVNATKQLSITCVERLSTDVARAKRRRREYPEFIRLKARYRVPIASGYRFA